MCLVPIEAISPMEHATLKINHEYKPSTCAPIQKHTLTKRRGKVHIFHSNLKFHVLVTVISSLLPSTVLVN